MTMKEIGFEATLQLTIQGPILVHSSEIGPWGVDALPMRSSDGHLVIPGDQIQGKVREVLEQIGADYSGWKRSQELDGDRADHRDNDDEATGRVADNAVSREDNPSQKNEPASEAETENLRRIQNLDRIQRRYPVFFSDFQSLVVYPPPGASTITQVAMDPETGAAEAGQLRVLDGPVPSGGQAAFTGQVRFLCRDSKDASEQISRIISALKWNMSVGSNRSIGFGRIQNVHCLSQTQTKFNIPVTECIGTPDQSFLLDIVFADPVCVPEGLTNGNIYETKDVIPGETIRGAIAMLLNRIAGLEVPGAEFADVLLNDGAVFGDLCRQFHRIRITTARPVRCHSEPEIPAVVPLSTGTACGKVFDFALMSDREEATLFDGQAAAFSPDWKGDVWQAVNAHFGIVKPDKELRVHTEGVCMGTYESWNRSPGRTGLTSRSVMAAWPSHSE
ncbi:MAG: hypothetical protein R3C49_03420 [Planctomycetaceae bacterium]